MDTNDGNAAATTTSTSTTTTTVMVEDVARVREYLARIVALLWGADSSSSSSSSDNNGNHQLEKSLSALLQKNEDSLRAFVSDGQSPVLIFTKTSSDVEEEPALGLLLEITFKDDQTSAVAFIKRGPVIEANRNLNSQLQLINLPEGSPFQTLHSYIRNAVAPFFNSYVSATSTGAVETASDKDAIPTVKRKMAELELSLLHLQRDIQIPKVTLVIHPLVQQIIDQAAKAKRKATLDDFSEETLKDQNFLGELQHSVIAWAKEIQKVTKLSNEPIARTSLNEVNFWLEFEKAINEIDEQMKADGVGLTRDVLQQAKRFLTFVTFDSDTGLKEAREKVGKYTQLMRDFPLNDLLSAVDMEKIKESLVNIFSHLGKKLKSVPYPVLRAVQLVEAISRDLNDIFVRILSTRRIMQLDFDEFERLTKSCEAVFAVWNEQYKSFVLIMREIAKKRGDKTLTAKLTSDHGKLQTRLQYIYGFRRQHHQLRLTISKVMRHTTIGASNKDSGEQPPQQDQPQPTTAEMNMNAIEDVDAAYDFVAKVDVLDVSKEGTDLWVSAETSYNERVGRVENEIIAHLRESLGKAHTASEMFRVFSQYNVLFIRPKIRGAIQEYQNQLVEKVKEDIRLLQNKFKQQYPHSEAARMSAARDLPEVSGAIIWARQLERQLTTYMSRVETVFGSDLASYGAGEKLQAESSSFRKKLDTRPIFDEWVADINRRDLKVSGRVFEIVKNRSRGVLELTVNYDEHLIALFKEVRNLSWLGFQVPMNISSTAREGKKVYPYAVSLRETIRSYASTNEKLRENPEIAPLVAGYVIDVQQKIAKCSQYSWSIFTGADRRYAERGNVGFVRELSQAVSIYQDRVDELLLVQHDVAQTVHSLRTCPFAMKSFREILENIQKLIDKLNLESYANLEVWVDRMDSQVQDILIGRLRIAIQAWISEFMSQRETTDGRLRSDNQDESQDKSLAPKLGVLVHELRIKDQVMYLDPPLEHARESWISLLYDWIGLVCDLPKLQSSRYEIGTALRGMEGDTTYRSLLMKLLDGDLQRAYEVIETKLRVVHSYVAIWLRYQALWDLEANSVFARLGEDLSKWQQILSEIKRARSTFDNSETEKSFGCLVIHYGQVQAKVNAKYDAWQNEVLHHFGSKLGEDMSQFHSTILKARSTLEEHSLEGESTAESVSFITFVQDLKRKVSAWQAKVESFRAGQRLLERQRFRFPTDWIYFDNVSGEWSAFNEILTRQNTSIQNQYATLQLKIVNEDRAVDERIKDLISDWDKSKPIQGDIKPETAMNTLAIFESRMIRAQDEYVQICRAKEALNLDLAGEDRVAPILEELKDLKGVWAELSKLWQFVYELRDLAWTVIVPRKIRQQLDQYLTTMKGMPARLRNYAAFEYLQNVLRGYVKVNLLVNDLKSEALRERHWKLLFRRLKVEGRYSLSEMTLGNLWDLNLVKNEATCKDVILIAQGEMALEEFLKNVRETWQTYELDLVNYQNKCRLIRGWDELFLKCNEHLNSLSAMKLSPYFKAFEDDALAWEEKLNRVNMIFDVWIDVQRQWVYLEGIFAGSADIKNLLPQENSRFQSINSEFLAHMKKVAKSPLVLDVLAIPNAQSVLDRLAGQLAKIQKALGEYLERERSAFPRFYFVGDEDLLEIIGNSKDVIRIQKHFKKLFAGVSQIILSDDEKTILGMASREGEQVLFVNPISLANGPKINEWLTQLENEMRATLAHLLEKSLVDLRKLLSATSDKGAPSAAVGVPRDGYLSWVDQNVAQLIVLCAQIVWTEMVEAEFSKAATSSGGVAAGLEKNVLARLQDILNTLADTVLEELPPIQRRKCEHLITELVHERDVVRHLIQSKVASAQDFHWLYHMRFYFNTQASNIRQKLVIRMANASFEYGFEYLGLPDRLVQTPLTDRCYLTLCQALELRLGGSPFGPAGTGKTESVKALGCQLGRFVLVFCCDEHFDFQAMGRIFIGLCQVGAWGCFDEFNRLEERILSAVSQQVQTIQIALKESQNTSERPEIELVDKRVRVHTDTGIFITMNPGYAGRSNLPDNLKKLFRSLAMTNPDRELIAQVMLYSQGFRTAELIASKIVPFFNLCLEQLSAQPHYDFGLRALKSVLVSAGNLKRSRLQQQALAKDGSSGAKKEGEDTGRMEQEILIQSVAETVVPKLVAEDIPLLKSLLSDVFPGIPYVPADVASLRTEIINVSRERHLVPDDAWVEKVLQLYQIQRVHHGLMMVGPSGSGKTMAWNVLLAALERLEGVEGVSYVIDPKAIKKEALYGVLDSTTREWTDGLFTHILRKVVDNVRGELNKRHWIVFDGDVDPEWVENLNSVLDDNKLLTLPNGERLSLPPCVRIMFEVQDLRYATLATVSRCGMIWFSEQVITLPMMFHHYLTTLRHSPVNGDADAATAAAASSLKAAAPTPATPTAGGATAAAVPAAEEVEISPVLRAQREMVDIMEKYFTLDGLVVKALEHVRSFDHIMEISTVRLLNSFFSMMNRTVSTVLDYNDQHADFPMSGDHLEKYLLRRLIFCLVWSLAGDCPLTDRGRLGDFLVASTSIQLPAVSVSSSAEAKLSVIDFYVNISTGDWSPWHQRVPVVEIDTHRVTAADVVIPTVDTVRHEDLLYTWLSEHKPLILCGPPGSGKTMTLFSALRALPDLEVVGLNFSSATSPELILKTFEQYCEYRKTPNGMTLAPVVLGKWLVLFCDEINLPAEDKYGTQRVISFMRQMVEQKGFWRPSDKSWVRLERIQFVGACNPPTDPGRVPLSPRFLRHAPVVMVDYPGQVSLHQIYGTFSRALLKVVPNLRSFAEPLALAMVAVYLKSQRHFTTDVQAHYIYSPRELTRWVRGIYEAIRPLDNVTPEAVVRLWAHEGLRLFSDRLVTPEERHWMFQTLVEVANEQFPSVNFEVSLRQPILFSDWLSKEYVSVDQEVLRDFVKARLRVFYEEELDVQLVLFNDLLDHVLRIDRVFKQVQGHLLLIGVSGTGKTTLSRFVAWMNGLSVFQIKVHNQYKMDDFDEDLRTVLRRAGCKGEKICFIMDESNILDPGFLERMNTLLANGEVPGLFDGDEYSALMTQCKEGSQRAGVMLDSADELYKWFIGQVMRNLHVVFTMNPPDGGLGSRAATSPALFNRCVLDWFGDWSPQAYYQVGHEFTEKLDVEVGTGVYYPPDFFPVAYEDLPRPPSYRDAIVNAFVFVHNSLAEVNRQVSKRQNRRNHITPRHYLDFIQHYVKLFNQKRQQLEEQQLHLNVGLKKLKDTFENVEELQKTLEGKNVELEKKNAEANLKLKYMVEQQKEAEQEKAVAEKLQQELDRREAEIAKRKQIAEADLSKAEPAVRDAEQSVKNIKKQQLVELRSMANPPPLVKLALESVCLLLNEKNDSWKEIQSVVRKDDFIASVANYDTERMLSEAVRRKFKQVYLADERYTFENVDHASKACGPLVQWAIAQVSFAEILDRVEPLRNEVKQLETEASVAREKAVAIQTKIAELEKSIGQYKEEYAVLITESQALKVEMEQVKTKVERATNLLRSLSSERDRWSLSSETFESQMGTIVGDVLLSAAFLCYGGFFDQHYRTLLFTAWSEHLREAAIHFKPEISLAEYLSTADDRLGWQANALPADDLCTENAIMLQRFNRYPLIIDPSGQATRFILNQYKERKINKTSFLDKAFLKTLESALRFGNPLLVEDVESLDPILNPLLNKELRRTGGRVLVRLGSQDIDFSPSFMLFLTTRDPTANFAPDLCSRVTFVNFTVTQASLQSQCLHQVLKVERPTTDQKRVDLLKMQGEFQLRLRHLEQELLDALNFQGSILENDTVISTLERLKKEAAEIEAKFGETEVIMTEVESVTALYTPLAQACSSIYFVMERLVQLHHFYQYSLDFFYQIFESILNHNPNLREVANPDQRLTILRQDLFATSFARVSRGLLHQDHVAFALLLLQIYSRGTADEVDEAEYDMLLSGGLTNTGDGSTGSGSGVGKGSSFANLDMLDDEQQERLRGFTKLECLRSLPRDIAQNADRWRQFLDAEAPEAAVPTCWTDPEKKSRVVDAFRRLLVVACLRPDRVVSAASLLVEEALGKAFLLGSRVEDVSSSSSSSDGAAVDSGKKGGQMQKKLAHTVLEEFTSANPIAFCSVPGYDASYMVDGLVAQLGMQCTSVAIGSAEGYSLADKAIASASKSGTWVLLKNVHLAPQWLVSLEKKLHALQAHPKFRLFLTMEINPRVPASILRLSRIFMHERPPGVKANLNDSLASLSPERVNRAPVERSRLYLLMAWCHAVFQERLRYTPLGWTKVYDFNDADLRCGFDVIDAWIDNVANGRTNVDPAKIPWDALRTLLSQSVYGGRIDSAFDQLVLDSFLQQLFVPESYNADFRLVDGASDVVSPEKTTFSSLLSWLESIPSQQSPTWLALPRNAEKVLLISQGNALLSKVRNMRSLGDDSDLAVSSTAAGSAKGTSASGAGTASAVVAAAPGAQPSWIASVAANVSAWLKLLPADIDPMPRSTENLQDPLYRYFEREVSRGRKLLGSIRSDLTAVGKVCEGAIQTNHLRSLLSSILKGIVPKHWQQYKVPADISLNVWIADLAQRLPQLATLSKCPDYSATHIWLGGLFVPEAFVTATRQAVAQKNQWSLEEVELQLSLAGDSADAIPGTFLISRLRLEGATWDASALHLSDTMSNKLPVARIRWVRTDAIPARTASSLSVPVYLNSSRKELLFNVNLDADPRSTPATYYQRGVAFVASSLKGV